MEGHGDDSHGADGEEQLFRVLEDLEAHAGTEFAAERAAEVADRVRAEYREVTLTSRLHASVGLELACRVEGVGMLVGELLATGPDWCEVAAAGRTWLVGAGAVLLVRGASERSVPDAALRVSDRLGWASRVRRLADAEVEVLVHLRDGSQHRVRVLRVGADFVEVREETGQVLLVAWRAVAALRVDAFEE